MPLKLVHDTVTIKNIIGVASGKGGVGKSTLTVQLAYALKKQGLSVGILDADIYGPSLQKMLPEDSLPEQKGANITPAVSNGIKYISLAHFRKVNDSTVVRGPIASKIILEFLNHVDWGFLDFLLIDFPPGTGDVQLTLSQKAKLTGAVMITTPQEVSLLDVQKAIDMFKTVHIPVLGLVENMSHFIHPLAKEIFYLFGSGKAEKLAEEFGLPFWGQVPLDPVISESCDKGAPDLAARFFEHMGPLLIRSIQECQASAIEKIFQPDRHSVTVVLTSGHSKHFLLHDLQKNCPCARCAEMPEKNSDPLVEASHIEKVGNYAIKIGFTSGCKNGIFSC